MVWIGEHGLHTLADFVGSIGKVDAVAERFAHLRFSIGSGQAQAGAVLRKKNLRFHKGRTISIVEAADNFAGLLNHGLLVFAYGHGRGLECGYIGGLAYGICEESHRYVGLEVAHFDFRFHGRVALKPRYCYQIHVVERKLAQFRHLRLDEDGALCRVDTAGKIVECHLDNVLAHFSRIVGVVGQSLGVGNHYENLIEFS